MSTSFEDATTTKVQMLSEDKQHKVMSLIDELLKEEQTIADERSIGDMFAALSAKVAIDEWLRLPADGSGATRPLIFTARRRRLIPKRP